MENIKMDLQMVDVEQISPNAFNPKLDVEENSDNKERYEQVKKSIRVGGLDDALLVRQIEDGKYELIDGFHRWKACQELGYKKIIINNLGEISTEEAKQRLLRRENARIPIDPIKEAELIRDLANDFTIEEMTELLPYSTEILQNKLDLLDFDWNSFESKEGGEGDDGMQKIVLKVGEYQYNIIMKAISKSEGKDNETSITKICEDYIDE